MRVLTFKIPPNYEDPDYSNNGNVYNVTVRANDGSLSDDKDMTITVTHVNEPPVVSGPVTLIYDENGTGPVAT